MQMLRKALARLRRDLRLRLEMHIACEVQRQLDQRCMPQKPARRAGELPAWSALPGDVLELGHTGWQIYLVASSLERPYVLHTPEGKLLCGGNDLPGIKALAERFARERAQFQAERETAELRSIAALPPRHTNGG